MKIFVFLAFIVVSIFSSPVLSNDRALEANLRKVIESQRPNFVCGWKRNGAPPIDPIFVAHKVIEGTADGTSFHSTLTNVNIRNTRTFVINRLELNSAARTLRFRVTIPTINVNGRHRTNIGIPLVGGSGALTATVTNGFVVGVLHWRTTARGTMEVYRQDSNFNAQRVVVNLAGMGITGSRVNREINNAIPGLLNEPSTQKAFNQFLSEIFLPMFNSIISNKTPAQVASTINYLAANPIPPNC